MTSNPAHVIGHFENLAYGLAAGLATAHSNGIARGSERVAAVHADRAEAAALDDVIRVARAVTADRLEIRRLQAENAALRAELLDHRNRASALALRDARRRA